MPASKIDDKKKKSNLLEIRDILKNELNKFSNISTTLKDTSEGLNNIDNKYHEYNREIEESKTHIIKLKRREFFENLFVYIALIFYICCLIYITLKRFPVHKILYLAYYILEFITRVSFLAYNSIKQNLNETLNNKTLEINESFTGIGYNSSNITYMISNATEIVNNTIHNIVEFIALNKTISNSIGNDYNYTDHYNQTGFINSNIANISYNTGGNINYYMNKTEF